MNHRTLATIAVLLFALWGCPCRHVLGGEGKTRSVFMPLELRERAWANIRQDEAMTRLRDQIVERARPWMELSDDQVWGLMFGPGITRSWMVWSDGHCPACGKSVPMYNWRMDALSRPWKTWCPHCAAVFPANDFEAFYRSGLDRRGIFDPALADRSLLFNAAHPDPNDPRHRFGVDDGEGFVQDGKRWRFIGAYLVDGMNLGLFALGLDLMPDFGYPPVQFGGWDSARSRWYHMTASHNTIVVDGKNQANASGTTTLWKDGRVLKAVRASCPAMIGGRQFERTVASVDAGTGRFYVLDVFRVVGGKDHAKFMHSHFATLRAEGLKLEPGLDYEYGTHMRNFRHDTAPGPGWNVTWDIEDRYGYLTDGARVRLRYTDLTAGGAVATAEAWVIQGGYDSSQETWIPRLMVRRTADREPLASCFVGIIEPYSNQSAIQAVERLVPTVEGKAMPDGNVALRVDLADGRADLIVVLDTENPLNLRPSRADGAVQVSAWGLVTDAELCLVRLNAAGQVEAATRCGGTFIELRGQRFHTDQPADHDH